MACLKLVSELAEGMITAEPIVNNFGQTIMPSGMEMKTKHIEMLKVWNIQTVYIKSDENDSDVEISKEILIQAKEILSKKCPWEPRNVLEENVVELGILSIAHNLINKGGTDAK